METFLKFLSVALGIVALALLAGLLVAFPIMWIWNWMMPELFGMPFLTVWQAFWGSFMARLIFGTGSTSTVKSK